MRGFHQTGDGPTGMTWKNGVFHPTQKRAAETKDRLLQAALELFDKHGFHATNAKEIAAAAGVGTGTFYLYFQDKKALFLVLLARMEETHLQRLQELGQDLANSGATPARVIETLVSQSIALHEHYKGFHREVLALEMIDADIRAWCLNRDRRIRRRFCGLLESLRPVLRTKDLEVALEMTFLAVEAVAHRAVIFESDLGRERLTAACLDMLKRFLLADEIVSNPLHAAQTTSQHSPMD